DATLIAADINNYLYASNGTPNQIPVISLFQDVDYEHKLFTRHAAQVLDGNNVETYEPRVLDIVLYNTVKSGTSLTTCQTYYSVPTEDLTAKWVSISGNDTTGTGTKALPYLTISKAQSVTASNVYLKTGTHGLGAVALTVSKNIIGLGYSIINNFGASNAMLISANNTRCENFIIDGTTTGNGGIRINTSVTGVVLNRIKMINPRIASAYVIRGNGSNTNTTIQNSIFNVNNTIYIEPNTGTYNVINCYFGETVNCVYPIVDVLINMDIKYNKINTTGRFIYSLYNVNEIRTTGNKGSCYYLMYSNDYYLFSSKNDVMSVVKLLRVSAPLVVGTCQIENSIITANSDEYILSIVEKNFLANNLHITQSGGGSVIEMNSATNSVVCNIENSLLRNTNKDGDWLCFGTLPGTTLNKVSGYIKKSKIIGPKEYGSSNHGLILWNTLNFEIAFNYFDGYPLPLVLKAPGADYSNVLVHHNLFLRGKVTIKGVDNSKIINNTFYDNYLYAAEFEPANLNLVVNYDVGTEHPINTIVRNNISVMMNADKSNINITTPDETYISSSNVYYSVGGDIITDGVNTYNLTEWQGLGNETNSVFTNPSFNNPNNNEFWLTTPITTGENLGSTYSEGLDASTDWGSDSELPVVVTKQQGASWDIGAYIH
ncbi:MAG TPA: hypothetical protein VK153_01185, partial [Candidatus Paceibacterota bacterium]|nr:hypothetical protein [Candidatus Paceibacterota bacterium]